MATAKQFLDAIEVQKIVPEDVLDDLYKQYRASAGAVTADTLAKRLVASGALSQDQVNVLLQSPSDSFIQLGADSLGASDLGAPGLSGSSVFSSTGMKPAGGSGSSSSGSNIGDPFAEELESKRARAGEKRDAAGRRKHVAKKHKNDFDSPLLLIGGGVLSVLALVGVGLTYVMNTQSGDQLLDAAQQAYASGSYAQAREDYEKFVEDFDGHARWSEARVSLATTRLRQLTETSSDWPKALEVAQQELGLVRDEPAFADKRGEFAAILPRIARGLAERADGLSADSEGSPAGDPAGVDRLVAAAGEALKLVDNTNYVPKSLRDDGEVAEIVELLARVERRAEAAADLAGTVEKIKAATAAGGVGEAYAAHADFVARRAELRDDPRLADSLAAAVEAERKTVRFVEDRAPGATAERPTAVALALPLADPRLVGEADAAGLFVARHAGVLYGVDARSGALRWRRPIGESLSEVNPTRLDGDLLIVDHRHGDLVRVRAATGDIVWRAEVEAPQPDSRLQQPVVSGDRVLLASESGRLWSIDAASGERLGYAQFAQPLRAAPAVSEDGTRAYLVGEQSSLYTLDAATLECLGVAYTGHAKGTAPAPPVALAGRVLMPHNAGLETSVLAAYATDPRGVVAERLADWRQSGVVSTAALVSGRRVLSVTESGAAYVYEAAAEENAKPLSLVASRVPDKDQAGRRRGALRGGDVWIAGRGLVRSATSLADSQLVVRPIPHACDGDLFVGPVAAIDGAILHARLRAGRTGLTVAATNASSGEPVWETDLADPPLVPPAFSAALRGVVATTASGDTHLVGPAAIKARVSAAPVTKSPSETTYTFAVGAGGVASVLGRSGDAEWVASTVSPRPAARRSILAGELAAPPTALGDALLAPLRVGQVHLLDASGRAQGAPFQPEVAVGQSIAWSRAAAGRVEDQEIAVLTDGAETVYALAKRGAALVALGQARTTEGAPIGPCAIVGRHATVALPGGRLALFELPTLAAERTVELPADAVWGPHPIDGAALVATSDGALVAVDPAAGRVAWSIPLGDDRPVGEPLSAADGVVVVTRSGTVVRLDPATGDALGRAELGESLGSGATAYATRLLVAAADGSVLVINKP